MSYGTQESDGAVGTTNPKFEVIIRSCADCTLKFCPQSRLVFRVSGVVKAFEWNGALAGIEAIHAKGFRPINEIFARVTKLHAQLPIWVRLCASARYACSRRNSCVSSSCSVTSIVVPRNPLKTPCSTTGTPTQRTYRTSPSGRTIRFITSTATVFAHASS